MRPYAGPIYINSEGDKAKDEYTVTITSRPDGTKGWEGIISGLHLSSLPLATGEPFSFKLSDGRSGSGRLGLLHPVNNQGWEAALVGDDQPIE